MYDLAAQEFTENDVLVMGSDGMWERFQNADVSFSICLMHCNYHFQFI